LLPFGVHSVGSLPTPGLPPPDYHRRAQGFSPSPRLDGSQRAPGLFHPGPAHGVAPFRAFSLCRAVTSLDVPCLPDVCRTLPAPDRSPNDAATNTAFIRSPVRCRTGSQAPWAPTGVEFAPLAARLPPRRSFAGSIPPTEDIFVQGPRCRSPVGVRFAFKAFAPCKELGSLGRWLSRFRGRCPPGLLLSRALSRGPGGRHFSAAIPSRASATTPATSPPRASRRPLRVFSEPRLDAPLARCVGPHEVLHLVTPSSSSTSSPPLAAAGGSLRVSRLVAPPAFPRTPGLRCRSPAGPLRDGTSDVWLAP